MITWIMAFLLVLLGDKELIQVNNEIKALETELILNGSIACDSNASNDLLLSSEISQDKANKEYRYLGRLECFCNAGGGGNIMLLNYL